MRIITFLFFLISATLLQNCAQISAPTGGKADETPPQLDSANTFPAIYSTQFTSDKIKLTFNEYFVLKKPKANVFITPRLENNPTFITKGKTLTILLNNKLKENTTYTINFGESISDYTVGNKIPDFKYVFSTGDFIDSCTAEGSVINSFTGKPEEGIYVMLYEELTDSVVSNKKPLYYSKTNKQGDFSLTYIKAGNYKLVALGDKNQNFKYDLPNEKIGTISSNLNLKDTAVRSSIVIPIFVKENTKQGIIKKKYTFPGKLSLTFKKAIDTFLLYDKDSNLISYSNLEISKKRDSIVLWNPSIKNEKTDLLIKLDTFEQVFKVYNYVKPTKNLGPKKENHPSYIDVVNPLIIRFSRPIKSIDSSKIKLYRDSNLVLIDSIKTSAKELLFYFQKQEKTGYRYELLPGAITDIFDFPLEDTLKGKITVRELEFYGAFTLNFIPNNDSVSYLAQLLNEKGKIIAIRKLVGENKVTFSKLFPEKYTIKIIEDLNKNGKWDTGNYYKKLTPESIFYFPKEIEIRSNWEVAETFNLN